MVVVRSISEVLGITFEVSLIVEVSDHGYVFMVLVFPNSKDSQRISSEAGVRYLLQKIYGFGIRNLRHTKPTAILTHVAQLSTARSA